MNVEIKPSVDKKISKIAKGDLKAAIKIRSFLRELANEPNPFALANALKMQGYENRWRYKIAHYRIIAAYHKDIITIEIIEITSRENAYK